jgi:hypothetical protein
MPIALQREGHAADVSKEKKLLKVNVNCTTAVYNT